MWTPRFPLVAGYQLPEGARPVYAVQVARVLVGQDIKVEISVLLGSAVPPGVPIATVLVSPGSRVVVDQLTRFGVQPLTLSMVDVAPMTPFVPTVISVSPDIEIADVEVRSTPYPGYRITLRNIGDKAVSNVHLESYRGEEKALSALKRTDDGRPLMQPGATYTFSMNVTSEPGDLASGAWTPRPIDVIEFDSVRWADGTHHGTPPSAQLESLVESKAGRQLQLRRIVEALRQALGERGSGLDSWPPRPAGLARCRMRSPISWRERRWRCGPPRPRRWPTSRACRTTTRRRLTRGPSSRGCDPCWRATKNGWRA